MTYTNIAVKTLPFFNIDIVNGTIAHPAHEPLASTAANASVHVADADSIYTTAVGFDGGEIPKTTRVEAPVPCGPDVSRVVGPGTVLVVIQYDAPPSVPLIGKLLVW